MDLTPTPPVSSSTTENVSSLTEKYRQEICLLSSLFLYSNVTKPKTIRDGSVDRIDDNHEEKNVATSIDSHYKDNLDNLVIDNNSRALHMLISQNIIQRNVHPCYVLDTMVSDVYNTISKANNVDCSNTDLSAQKESVLKSTFLPICYCCGGPIQPGLFNTTARIHSATKKSMGRKVLRTNRKAKRMREQIDSEEKTIQHDTESKQETKEKDSSLSPNNNAIIATTTISSTKASTIRRRKSRKKAKMLLTEQQNRQKTKHLINSTNMKQTKIPIVTTASGDPNRYSNIPNANIPMPANEYQETNLFRFCYGNSRSINPRLSNTIEPTPLTAKNYMTVRCGICSRQTIANDSNHDANSDSDNAHQINNKGVIVIDASLPRRIVGIRLNDKSATQSKDTGKSSCKVTNSDQKKVLLKTSNTSASADSIHNRIAIGSSLKNKKRKMNGCEYTSNHGKNKNRNSTSSREVQTGSKGHDTATTVPPKDFGGVDRQEEEYISLPRKEMKPNKQSTESSITPTMIRANIMESKRKKKRNNSDKKKNPLMDFLSSLND